MLSLAEVACKYGTDEFTVSIILAPDTVLTLFLDGSSILESRKAYIVYESCWR